MDPMACVRAMESLYSMARIEEARELMRGYLHWQRIQGFRPRLTNRQRFVVEQLKKQVKNEVQS